MQNAMLVFLSIFLPCLIFFVFKMGALLPLVCVCVCVCIAYIDSSEESSEDDEDEPFSKAKKIRERIQSYTLIIDMKLEDAPPVPGLSLFQASWPQQHLTDECQGQGLQRNGIWWGWEAGVKALSGRAGRATYEAQGDIHDRFYIIYKI